jgi:phosphoribosylformylglycinamidine synthase
MIKANIYVSLKESVLDPQGKVINDTIKNLGFTSAIETRTSKLFEITFNENDVEKTKEFVKKISETLLVNPNTETYTYELVIVK